MALHLKREAFWSTPASENPLRHVIEETPLTKFFSNQNRGQFHLVGKCTDDADLFRREVGLLETYSETSALRWLYDFIGTQGGQIGRLTSVGLVLVALVISGCGGSYWKWSKPGVSQQQARQDGFECKQISREQYVVGTGNMIVGGSEPNFDVWKECLEARGYTVTKQSDSQGSHCVASNSMVGTRVKSQDGKIMKVTTLYGNSPRCSNPATPILVDVEEVGKEN